MRLSTVSDFDRSVFTDTELEALQKLADQCAKAKDGPAIEAAGSALDDWRGDSRTESKRQAIRAQSRNALYKRLVGEVPRRTNTNGETVAAPDRKGAA